MDFPWKGYSRKYRRNKREETNYHARLPVSGLRGRGGRGRRNRFVNPSGSLDAAFCSRLARICLERFLLPTQLLSSFSKHLLSGGRASLICLSRRQDQELTGLHSRTFFFVCSMGLQLPEALCRRSIGLRL